LANKSTSPKKQAPQEQKSLSDPWISRRTGLITTTIVSIAIAVWMYFQAPSSTPITERLLWSLVFAANVWFVFGLMLALNRYLRK